MNNTQAILNHEIEVIFGTGKSFAKREKCVLEAGTPIGRRWNADGFHFFIAVEYGRNLQYAVSHASLLDAAIAN